MRILLAVLLLVPAAMAQPATEAAYRPGTQLDDPNCTANWLFADAKGQRYLGTASHCMENWDDASRCALTLTGPTRANVIGAKPGDPLSPTYAATTPKPIGTVVYSSLRTMKVHGETDEGACAMNDLALIRLTPEAARLSGGAAWTWGSPSGIATTAPAGSVLHSFTSSQSGAVGRPNAGVSLGSVIGWQAWSIDATFAGGCIPGDSGSPVLVDGKALGVLNRGAGNVCLVSLLQPMLDYMASHGGPRVTLIAAR
jgi:hypothetical protein